MLRKQAGEKLFHPSPYPVQVLDREFAACAHDWFVAAQNTAQHAKPLTARCIAMNHKSFAVRSRCSRFSGYSAGSPVISGAIDQRKLEESLPRLRIEKLQGSKEPPDTSRLGTIPRGKSCTTFKFKPSSSSSPR